MIFNALINQPIDLTYQQITTEYILQEKKETKMLIIKYSKLIEN